jgi:dihydroorotase (multifunctional complex type)
VFVAIGAPRTLQGHDQMDASGMLVLPGAIDMHVHFREPGATHKEDFRHGTAAAACGGVTSVCDMPNTKPAVTNAQVLAQKLTAVQSCAHVDFAFWAGGVETDEFAEFRRLGAVGLKVYMNRAPAGSQSYSDELTMPDDATFVRVLRAAAELDWPVSVHVANSSLDDAVQAELMAQGRRQARDVCLMTRSRESAEAQARIIHFAQITRARLHIAHISYNSLEALEGLRIARTMGARVTAEVAPPCLSFADLDRIGAFGTPFAHSDDDNDRYWNALREGLIDAVATDHAPHTREEKLKGAADAWLAPTGYPAVETMLPLLVDAVLRGRLTFERLVAVAAGNPARICSFESKGAIAIGKDADLAIVDPAAEWVVDEARLHSKAGWSPFHGRRLRGRVRHTFLRGNEIARDGELVASKSGGRPVSIAASTAPRSFGADPGSCRLKHLNEESNDAQELR